MKKKLALYTTTHYYYNNICGAVVVTVFVVDVDVDVVGGVVIVDDLQMEQQKNQSKFCDPLQSRRKKSIHNCHFLRLMAFGDDLCVGFLQPFMFASNVLIDTYANYVCTIIACSMLFLPLLNNFIVSILANGVFLFRFCFCHAMISSLLLNFLFVSIE